MNFWAVIAYYLASPLNLLLLVFPKSMVMECFTFIYLIKIGLAGLSFSVFLKKRFDHYGPVSYTHLSQVIARLRISVSEEKD